MRELLEESIGNSNSFHGVLLPGMERVLVPLVHPSKEQQNAVFFKSVLVEKYRIAVFRDR
jgi:hypothetical protein